MAVEVPSPAQVRAIITTSLTDEQVQAVIEDAALMVTDCVADYDAARQIAIVKWVTAHLISGMGLGGKSARMTSRKLGDASETFSSATVGAGMSGTSYGQQAIALDPSGCIAGLGTGQRQVIVRVL